MKHSFLLFSLIALFHVSIAQPCQGIETITCGNTVLFTSNALGDPAYPNGMNGQGCSISTAQGGQEKIYRFVAPATGTYQINTGANSGGAVVYFYRTDKDSCNTTTGWNCLERVAGNDNLPVGAANWNAGDTVLLLLNAEATFASSQSFTIECATVVCAAITNIPCGNPIQFTAFGYGSPSYPNEMNGQGCNVSTAQGGQEKIYRFVAPATGTYQVNTGVNSPLAASYYYRTDNDSCSTAGWTCMGSASNVDNIPIAAANWNTGDTILILVNAEYPSATSQIFTIECATIVCNSIAPVNYNDTTLFTAFGYGDPSYSNDMNGQGCTVSTAQGGQEKIYRFVVPATATYQINTGDASNAVVSYYYRTDNDSCNSAAGWTCLGSAANDDLTVGAASWIAGDTVLILLNAATAVINSQEFVITGAGVLPLHLASFKVINQGSKNKVTWSATGEINSSYFNVEYSEDGRNFEAVGTISATGNSSNTMAYSFDHLFRNNGKHYYRLKMVDLDGSFTYSDIVFVNNSNGIGITVAPNPASKTIHAKISYNRSANGSIRLIDVFGRTALKKSIQLSNGMINVDLPVASIADGSYILSVNGELAQQVFIKR